MSQAPSSVKVPAIFLIVVFSIGLLYALYSLIAAATGTDDQMAISMLRSLADTMQNAELSDAFRQAADQAEAQSGQGKGVFAYFMPLLWVFTNGLGVYGAIQMMKLRNYGLSMAAAIISIIPCIGPCCCGCAPVGIWALVVLSQAEVKQAFRG